MEARTERNKEIDIVVLVFSLRAKKNSFFLFFLDVLCSCLGQTRKKKQKIKTRKGNLKQKSSYNRRVTDLVECFPV